MSDKPPLGSIERAYADGYAAAKAEIERLRAKNRELREAITDCIHDRRDWMETALRALEEK